MEKGRKNISIPTSWLLDLLKATQGYQTRTELVIPSDAEVVSVSYKEDQDCVILSLQSDVFPSRAPFQLIETVTYGGKVNYGRA